MSSRIAFISLFLGLAAGMQSIDVQTDSAVKSLRILLDGREVAALTQPPWHAVVDFGRQLDPRPLEAIGFDEKGNEIGRASQFLNLPRPTAELEIVLQSGGIGPKGADLRWQHLQFKEPKSATLSFDRTLLKIDKHYHADFPETDWKHPHLIAAEMKFRDGIIARREIVAGGAVADTAQSELTPVLVMQTSRPPASFENCLLADGQPVRTAAVEKPNAIVIFVRDPDRSEALHAVDPAHQTVNAYFSRNAILHAFALADDTWMRYIWPIPRKFADAERQRAALLFDSSPDTSASTIGLVWFLTREYKGYYGEPLQLSDALAVAGLRSIAESRRRAVVLVVGKRPDNSINDPRAVRRYLANIGVPLSVWSLTGPRPELTEIWGEIEDVSSTNGLQAAADKLRENLAAQRIAWVDVDPLKALRLRADPRCGMATVARLGM
ncbi:MAG: hypothetical protein M3041_06465 [Acidobacteriota bacterium]|nr:hypothetical protein [Acidobacteriota bacterium]